jgi:hypothetical protein
MVALYHRNHWHHITGIGGTMATGLSSIYNCIYNFLKNVSLNDSTDEYFYKNITRVGTKEESSNHILPNGEKLISSEMFTLDVAGNREIYIVLSDPAIEKFTGGQLPTSRAEKAVNAIKKLVREKN